MEWSRLRSVWKRTLSLSVPIAAETVVRTAMRTTDVLVTALFSPAAVVAVTLGDLYARFPLRLGLGLGGGAIALSSQDTGADEIASRDEAITQALLIGLLVGLPFALVALLFAEPAIRLFDPSETAIRLGATYLSIVLVTAPARIVTLVAARSLQGTGDTRTPMYINSFANLVNIVGSVALGLGLFGAPELRVAGVGYATAAANVTAAALFVGAIASERTTPSFARPRSLTITRQLLQVSAPRTLEGFLSEAAQFPFNALLLSFPAGDSVTAGYQIARRLYQQVTAPISRSFNVAASVLVGQALGGGDPDRARFEGRAVAAFSVGLVGLLGLLLALAAPFAVGVFASDPTVTQFAVDFTRVYGLAGIALAAFSAFSGGLQGASETRIPLFARTSSKFGLFVGLSWLLALTLGYGPVGVYVGVGLSYLWMALVVWWGFEWTGWAPRATEMLSERTEAS
ncbi:MATE family efflux transporter [Halobacteriales archaeon SW_6_65_46]|nr:MAG: MATE family efflux transporter [Halobacteriales archaeon SW_6_65_46]